MKNIYTVTVCEKLEKTAHGFLDLGAARVVGWFSSFSQAEERVVHNICDIRECCYDYAVIEEFGEGLYPLGEPCWFYEYNEAIDEYVKIDSPPKWIQLFCNIAMG